MLRRFQDHSSSRQVLNALCAAVSVAGLVGFLVLVGRQADQPASSTPPAGILGAGATAAEAGMAASGRLPKDEAGVAAAEGLRELQSVRETGDLTAYGRAGTALDLALTKDPGRFEAVFGKAMLLLGLHQFRDGLVWAQRASDLNPYSAAPYGLIVDAQVELGRYDEALRSAQTMVDLRPDQGSYSRVSYLRELHGDVAGAVEAMQRAVASGPAKVEGSLWAMHQLAQLEMRHHRLDEAEATYRRALAAKPDFALGLAGLAEIAAARGQTGQAVAELQAVAAGSAEPDIRIALGELLEASGRPADAGQHFAAARKTLHLDREVGSDVELILAVFELEYGDRALALRGLDADRRAYERAPNVMAADQLAWLLFNGGEFDEAWRYSVLARRLGTESANFHYHAGMIAQARGDAEAARAHLTRAQAINPTFSTRHAPRARAMLASLQAQSANGGRLAGRRK